MALAAHPALEFSNQDRALLLTNTQTRIRVEAVDAPLNVKDGVDASDRLQCDRRDRRRSFAPARIGCDVGQFEELASRVRPAQRLRYYPWISI